MLPVNRSRRLNPHTARHPGDLSCPASHAGPHSKPRPPGSLPRSSSAATPPPPGPTPCFQWPLNGKIITPYGSSNGQKSDGIDIATANGTPVKAADGGKVVYSGDGVPHLGNLLLVEHSAGYITAYGNNESLLVKKDDVLFKLDPGPGWFASKDWAMTSLVMLALWGAIGGNMMLIFLAGLQGVPKEMYEAAEIDGAGRIQRFFSITVPMISPTLFLTSSSA